MSHYDNIGFTGITDSQSLVDTAKRVAPQAQEIGRFYAYCDPSGAELWIGTAEEGGAYAIEPYFAGCPQRVWITTVQAGEYGDGTGFAQVWQNGTEAEDGECTDGDYPFIMDIPDIAAFPESTIGTVQTVKVCAFAQSVECFADSAAYAPARHRLVRRFRPPRRKTGEQLYRQPVLLLRNRHLRRHMERGVSD